VSTWLVDTHALLWFLGDDPQLSPQAKATMESGANVLLVSAASVWEMAVKSSLGKLDVPDDLVDVLRREGFEQLGVSSEHAWAVRELPIGAHKDPFDRLLVAQAKLEGLPLISSDPQLDGYGIERLW
jgi:PIN domain nuclease of toxin-antitoxin system